MRESATQMSKAHNLGLELLRKDITDKDRIQISEGPTHSNPHDKYNGQIQCGPLCSDGERYGQYKPSRSKTFLKKQHMAKEPKRFYDKVLRLETTLRRFTHW